MRQIFRLPRITGLLSLALVGCAHPLAQSTAQYATLGQATAARLQPLSRVAHETCQGAARAEFLQQRLLRLQGEINGRLLDAKYYIDEWHWLSKANAISGTLTWVAYCQQMDKSAEAFASGLAALATYAKALGALSDTGRNYQPDWSGLVSSSDSILSDISNPDEHWTKFIAPVIAPIKELSHLWISRRAETSLGSALVESEPVVSRLIQSMDAYLGALREQLETLRTRQATLIQSLELASGFGSKNEPARIAQCRGAGNTDTEVQLRHLCEQSSLQQQQLDALVLLALSENSEKLSASTEQAIDRVAHYRLTLAALAKAQNQLASYAQIDNESNLDLANQELSRLAETLEKLESPY